MVSLIPNNGTNPNISYSSEYFQNGSLHYTTLNGSMISNLLTLYFIQISQYWAMMHLTILKVMQL